MTSTMEEALNVSTRDEDDDLLVDETDGPLGGRVIVVAAPSDNNKSTMNFETCEDKAADIRECLQLHSESSGSSVDLWELRQLAISPGGLLSPSLRQVAWPLLTGLTTASLSSLDEINNTVALDENLAESMQKDIEKSVWHLEELVRQSQLGKDSFWYAPLLNTNSEGGLETAPPMVLASPCSSSESTSHSQAESQGTMNSSLKPSSGGPTHQDQILLNKVLTKVLQGQTTHPSGLANLASLVMVNLESTSLSSLVLCQMTSYSLMAAFSGATVEHMASIMGCLLKALEMPCSDANTNVEAALTWFSGPQTSSLQAASRLMDAFLVSHPLFPIYVQAAAVDSDATWTMERVEELITVALDYMEKIPPSELLAISKASTFLPSAPAWTAAATAPADWAPLHPVVKAETSSPETCQQDHSFSDDGSDGSEWERLSAVAEDEQEEKPEAPSVVPAQEAFFCESYPLAMTAAGLKSPKKATTRSRGLVTDDCDVKPAEKGRRFLKLAFLVTGIVAAFVAALSQVYDFGRGGTEAPVLPLPQVASSLPVPQPTVQRIFASTSYVPTERPAHKTPPPVARRMVTTSKLAPAPEAVPPPVVQRVVYPLVSAPPPKITPSSPPSSPPRPMMMEKKRQTMVPVSPKSKWSFMIRSDESEDASDDDILPDEERLLQKFLVSGIEKIGLEDYVDSIKAAVVSTPTPQEEEAILKSSDPKLQPLRRQLEKLGKLRKKLGSFVRRIRNRRKERAWKKL